MRLGVWWKRILNENKVKKDSHFADKTIDCLFDLLDLECTKMAEFMTIFSLFHTKTKKYVSLTV